MFLCEKNERQQRSEDISEHKKAIAFFHKRSYCFNGSFINKNFTEINAGSACPFFKKQKRICVNFLFDGITTPVNHFFINIQINMAAIAFFSE